MLYLNLLYAADLWQAAFTIFKFLHHAVWIEVVWLHHQLMYLGLLTVVIVWWVPLQFPDCCNMLHGWLISGHLFLDLDPPLLHSGKSIKLSSPLITTLHNCIKKIKTLLWMWFQNLSLHFVAPACVFGQVGLSYVSVMHFATCKHHITWSIWW